MADRWTDRPGGCCRTLGQAGAQGLELFAKALPASPQRSPASWLFLLLLLERIYSVEIYYIDIYIYIFLLLNFLSTFILPQRVRISTGDNSSPSCLLNYLPEPGPWASDKSMCECSGVPHGSVPGETGCRGSCRAVPAASLLLQALVPL